MLHVILFSVLLSGTNGEKAANCNPSDSTTQKQTEKQQPKKNAKIDPPKTQKKEADVSPKVHMMLLDGIAKRR